MKCNLKLDKTDNPLERNVICGSENTLAICNGKSVPLVESECGMISTVSNICMCNHDLCTGRLSSRCP